MCFGSGWLIENDFDGHSLDDFDVVARCVLRRDQAELRAGTCLDAVYMSFENLIRISVNADMPPADQAPFCQFGSL